MLSAIIFIFIVGYFFIALEHPFKIDKAASALITGILCWSVFALFYAGDPLFVYKELQHHLIHISEILFFLLGAMTIVELVDAHQGFAIITDKINTNSRIKLLWILSFLGFFLSAVLDNLTTAIVMAALLPKLIKDKNDIWFFGGMLILACNAGGAWSPIGDVTTIMLWIGGQVTALNIITSIFIHSIVCMVVPLIYLSFKIKGNINKPKLNELNEHKINFTNSFERNFVFFGGVLGLLFVPVFKTVTHLPPYMGMLLSLGILWLSTELLHKNKKIENKLSLSVVGVLRKIDTATIFFFLGILLAVSCLQSSGILNSVANYLNNTIGNIYVINVVIGLLSSIVDNVPLVAGAMGMYPIDEFGVFAQDGIFWEFLAYCAGTGGSVLIIGSAAGVAVMGILKIDFIWYVKKISFLALLGYIYGALTYILLGLL
ncbi:MAG: sodium:proton antiporter [Flavobacteriales bacterium]|nr:sodium:proton antiporter [Flavobacteriales bacterium]